MASSTPGAITKLRNYFQDVLAELGKCSWPSTSELVQSTLVVVVSFLILGAFVFVADLVLQNLIRILL